MYWKDERHKALFERLRGKAGQGKDVEFAAAIYVLAAIGKTEIEKYIILNVIDFQALKRVATVWSSSEQTLLRLAATLFNAGTWRVSVNDVFYHLDRDNARVAIEALKIRYLGV